jgi:hypothetical protein
MNTEQLEKLLQHLDKQADLYNSQANNSNNILGRRLAYNEGRLDALDDVFCYLRAAGVNVEGILGRKPAHIA